MTRKHFAIALAITWALGTSPEARAQDLYVATCGNDSWSGASLACTAPDGPKATIQAAIDAAVDDDTIHVAAGTYLENIDFLGKNIVLMSIDGPDVTTLMPALDGSIVTITSGETSAARLEGFTLTGGLGSVCPDGFPWCGGAVYIRWSSPTIVGNIFIDNLGRGGGVFCRESASVIESNQFTGNAAFGATCGAILFVQASGALIDNNFQGNISDQSAGAVGAVNCQDLLISGNFFDQNIAGITGGGLAIWGSLFNYSIMVQGNEFFGNSAGTNGGGLCALSTDDLTIENNIFRQNVAGTNPIYAGWGGWRGAGNLGGGAIGVAGGWSGAGDLADGVLIRRNLIEGNFAGAPGSASWAGGVGIWSLVRHAVITENTIIGNTGINGGGGIDLFNHTGTVIASNWILQNDAALGGGVFAELAVDTQFVGNTVYLNEADDGGGLFSSGSVNTSLTNELYWANTAAQLNPQLNPVPSTTVSYSCIPGGWPGTGNFSDDPLFVSPVPAIPGPGSVDLHLQEGSPCIGAGDSTAAGLSMFDIDGDPRITCGTVDVGADEFDPPTGCDPNFARGDVNDDSLFDIADPVSLLSYLFSSGPAPACSDAADLNDDGTLNVGDAVSGLDALFGTTGPIPAPYPGCGVDPTADGLDCALSSCP